jgi:hypothetical protein
VGAKVGAETTRGAGAAGSPLFFWIGTAAFMNRAQIGAHTCPPVTPAIGR